MDRLDNLDNQWTGMADDAPTEAQAVLLDSQRLLLAVFRRRRETVADVAVMAAHAFAALDREVRGRKHQTAALTLVLRALADLATKATKAAGLDFPMIGPPDLPVRLRR
jgi:hypothetical protein